MTLGLLGPLLCIFHLLLLLLLLSAADPVVSGVSGALHYGPQTKVLTICIDDWLGVGGKNHTQERSMWMMHRRMLSGTGGQH